jgi:hypothetical protein
MILTMKGSTIKTEIILRREDQGLKGEIIGIIMVGMSKEITNQSMKTIEGRIHLTIGIGLIEMDIIINRGIITPEKTMIVIMTLTNITKTDHKIKNTIQKVDTTGGPSHQSSNINVRTSRKTKMFNFANLENPGTLSRLIINQDLSQDQDQAIPTRKTSRIKVCLH